MTVEQLYDIPQKQNISLREIDELGFINRVTAMKLLKAGKLHGIKIGEKWFVPRKSLIGFLEETLQEGKKAAESWNWTEGRMPKALKERGERGGGK